MAIVCASLLAADYARLGEEVQRAVRAGVNQFHFDMMDGHYVPNLALTPQHLKDLRRFTSLPFNAHLELDNPERILQTFNPLGADMVILQWDTLSRPERTFDLVRAQGAKVGLGIMPVDPVEVTAPLWKDLDLLLILGVDAGFGGQAMNAGTIEKIARARHMMQESGVNVPIAVDGGVNLQNIPLLLRAGAGMLIMGTTLFSASDMSEVVDQIRGL